MQILKDCVASFKSVDGEKQKKEGKVSVLHLQFLWKSNRVKEHAVLVKKLLKDYGSIRKASLQTGFPYKSLHRLCQPPVVRKKHTKQVWSDIRSFYTSNIISHELPSVKCKERRFLNLTLEECFSKETLSAVVKQEQESPVVADQEETVESSSGPSLDPAVVPEGQGLVEG